jgi:hypothetical protein
LIRHMSLVAFQFALPGAGTPTDALGLWQPAIVTEEISFSAAPSADTALFRVDLPPDPGQAYLALAQSSAQLQSVEIALGQAAPRLERFVQGAALSGVESVDFAAGAPAFAAPERELWLWLGLATDQPSFAPGLDLRSVWNTAGGQAAAFFEQVGQALAHFAWVESATDGQLVGRTTVGWTGDQTTFWRDPLLPGQVANHTRCLQLALATRAAWLRLTVTVAQGAARLAALASTAPILALPAAWKFVQELLAQYRNLQEIQ